MSEYLDENRSEGPFHAYQPSNVAQAEDQSTIHPSTINFTEVTQQDPIDPREDVSEARGTCCG
jgi:hypothetical protein